MPRWGEVVRPLLDLCAATDRESLKLATTRDELLPLLMSGKVRVRDAEKVVEGVA
jgi:type I restriction enzyme S subunit